MASKRARQVALNSKEASRLKRGAAWSKYGWPRERESRRFLQLLEEVLSTSRGIRTQRAPWLEPPIRATPAISTCQGQWDQIPEVKAYENAGVYNDGFPYLRHMSIRWTSQFFQSYSAMTASFGTITAEPEPVPDGHMGVITDIKCNIGTIYRFGWLDHVVDITNPPAKDVTILDDIWPWIRWAVFRNGAPYPGFFDLAAQHYFRFIGPFGDTHAQQLLGGVARPWITPNSNMEASREFNWKLPCPLVFYPGDTAEVRVKLNPNNAQAFNNEFDIYAAGYLYPLSAETRNQAGG